MPSAGMKRKEIEKELPDLSTLSPAWKLMRLDVDLSPIMEEDPKVPWVFEQQLPNEQVNGDTQVEISMTDAITADASLNERAVVLYNPVDVYQPSLLLPSGPNLPLKVGSDLIAGLKRRTFWPGNPNPVAMKEALTEDNSSTSDNCLAIIQWVPSPTLATAYGMRSSGSRNSQLEQPSLVDASSDYALMEIEELEPAATTETGTEVLQQWQQHCVTTEFLLNISAPMMRSR